MAKENKEKGTKKDLKKIDEVKNGTKESLDEKEKNIKEARRQLYYKNDDSSSDELSKLIKIILIVTGIIIVFYIVTVVVTEKAKEASDKSEPVEIQYDSITIGSMLKTNGSFYVLIEDSDDIRLSEYDIFLQTIKANPDAPTIYTADLDSSFNKEYLSDKTNYESDMSKFRVKGTTLVRIKDHKITNVYDNYDSISKKLDELD